MELLMIILCDVMHRDHVQYDCLYQIFEYAVIVQSSFDDERADKFSSFRNPILYKRIIYIHSAFRWDVHDVNGIKQITYEHSDRPPE